MAGVIINKGTIINQAGQPLTTFYLISKGSVRVEYPGGFYKISKGDVVGICEACSEIHYLDYVADEDTTVLAYPFSGMNTMDDFFTKHTDIARFFLLSLFRQINLLLAQSNQNEINRSRLRQNLEKDYTYYKELCARFKSTPRVIEDMDELMLPTDDKTPDLWLSSYYLGLARFYSGAASGAILETAGVSAGMLRKGSLDFRNAFSVLEDSYLESSRVANFYFHPSGNDLFDMLTSFYYRKDLSENDAGILKQNLDRIIQDYESLISENDSVVQSRIQNYRNHQDAASTEKETKEDSTDAISASVLKELSGSMNTILEYSGLDSDFCDTFRQRMNQYKVLPDCNSMADSVVELRHTLTADFYTLYSAVVEHSLASLYLPVPVLMFLYFGYIDEDLAGKVNCIDLYNLSLELKMQKQPHVYPFYHWLQTIYSGKKQPSRNEFEKDFTDYIQAHRQSGNLSERELLELEDNPIYKVQYELQNLFPLANKMTCGTITTFCPFFHRDNVLKDLKTVLVTPDKVNHELNEIREADFSAFYRESLDYDNLEIMGNRNIHVEYLPDIILMPNIGIRGIMWQEIEGKKRNTPGRMCCSIFHLENFQATMIRMTADFRWLLCKRIQGGRWNDVSVRSLTSEYYDYIQFYRKNHDLSPEAKDKIRLGLQRCKNSFKEMFIRDYMLWIMFECKGSPRLNKVARKIFFTYCPFSADQVDVMELNPLFTEMINRQKILNAQQLKLIENLKKKLKNSNQPIPETIFAECAYYMGSPIR